MRFYIVSVLFLLFFLKAPAFSEAQRILPMTPGLVEVVFSLGAGDRVIAVPEYTSWPAEALLLPSAGGYLNPNLERITALKPDLVLVQGRHEKLELYCKRKGIAVLHLSMESLVSIRESILAVGKALDLTERARFLADEMERGLEKIREENAAGKSSEIPVFIVLGRIPGTLSGIMTAGQGSFLTELVALSGGVNIFADHRDRYPMVSKEAILARQPEIILEIMPDGAGKDPDLYLKEWKKMASLPAVRKGRVYLVTEPVFLVPGPRIVQAAEDLARIIRKGSSWKN